MKLFQWGVARGRNGTLVRTATLRLPCQGGGSRWSHCAKTPCSGTPFGSHLAVLTQGKCKAAADDTRLQKLLAASESGDVDLFREMKSIKGDKKQHSTVTEHLDGVDGRENISEKFKAVYEALYNLAESSEEMNVIKEKLNNLIELGSIAQVNR